MSEQEKNYKKIVYITAVFLIVGGVVVGFRLKKSAPVIVNNVTPIINNTNVVLNGYMHKIVKCSETGQIWESVKSAAEEIGVSASQMSKAVNGHTPHIFGKHYSIVGLGC